MKKHIELLNPEITLSTDKKFSSVSITIPVKSSKAKDFLDSLTLLVSKLDNGKQALPKLIESIDYDSDFVNKFFFNTKPNRSIGLPLLRICVDLIWKIRRTRGFLKDNLQQHSKYLQTLVTELENESSTGLFFLIFYDRITLQIIDHFINNYRTLELFASLNTPFLFIEEFLKSDNYIKLRNEKNINYDNLKFGTLFSSIKYLVTEQVQLRNSSSGVKELIKTRTLSLYNLLDKHRKSSKIDISDDSIYTFIAVFNCAIGTKGFPQLKDIESLDRESGSQTFYIKYRTKVRDLLKPIFEENRKRGF